MLLSAYLVLCALTGPTLSLTDKELALFVPTESTGTEELRKSQLFAVDNEDGSITVTTNGLPSHEVGNFANPVRESWNSFTMFKEPIMRPEGKELTCLPSGPIGVAVSGAYIYSWWSAGKGCFYAAEREEFDVCRGTTSSNNQYRYHSYSPCVHMPVCGDESPLYGVALDGIPIFGPIADNGRQLTRIDLDKCGGRYDKSGRYKYHVTMDPPYFPSCFKGELRKDLGIPAEDFTCTCPYDDSRMGANGMSGGGQAVCDFKGDVSLPANCQDMVPLNATIGRKWEQIQRIIELAPCCPADKECGQSCETEKGTKGSCVVEERKVGVMTNMPKEVSCWEGCYVACIETEACNCKRKCRRECMGRNGSSDGRKKRESGGKVQNHCRIKGRKSV